MGAFEKAQDFLKEIEEAAISASDSLEQFRIRFLGSKNEIKDVFAEMKNIPNERKKEFGQLVNTLKQKAEERYAAFKEKIVAETVTHEDKSDLTMPGDPIPMGS